MRVGVGGGAGGGSAAQAPRCYGVIRSIIRANGMVSRT
jgi:hypothetical protein